MEKYDLTNYTVGELVELRESQLDQMSQFLQLKMKQDALEAKSLAEQCIAELKNRWVS